MKKKIIIGCVIGIGVLIATILVFNNVSIKKNNTIYENYEIIPEEEISDTQLRETMVNLYFINEKNELVEELRKIDSKELLENPYNKILNLLLAGPNSEGLKTYIPKDTKINNIIKNADCLTIDFSKEFIDNQEENTEIQGLTIGQIVNTVTQFTEINSIKIVIDGEENLSFKNGNINFSQIFTNED